jgi:hypothetical protein
MPNMQAVETKPKRGRPRNLEAPKFLQLRLPRDLHQRMKAQAADDALELTAWIRCICLRELRRRKKSSL